MEGDDTELELIRGCLLPQHVVLDDRDIAPTVQDSLVLVCGGTAQNVRPILEMVTEKYLLRVLNARCFEWRRIGKDFFENKSDSDFRSLIGNILPTASKGNTGVYSLDGLLRRYGFDYNHHKQIRTDVRLG